MKKPIPLNSEHLSTIISAMLIEKGLTEYTLKFDTFNELDLGSYGLRYSGEFVEGEDQPDSITVTLERVQ